MPAVDALTLLSGDAQTFVTKVWASRVHVHHGDADALAGYLSFDDVDHLLTSTAIRTPALRVAQDGAVLPASSYTRPASLAGQSLTGLVDPRRLLDLFDGGASVVLQGLHRYWPPLAALAADIERTLGHPCQANAYLTPPGAQGFAVHSDTHDVFVFQTHGTKMWEVHEGAEVSPVLLEPGVCMYLPTGTPHAARAQQAASLHVTLGINQVTWREVLDRAVRQLLDRIGAEHLPAGYLDDPGLLRDGLAERLDLLATGLREVDPDEVAAGEVERFLTSRSPSQRGGLRDRVALAGIGDDTLLTRRTGRPCVLVPDGDRLRVLLGDRELRVPGHLAPALDGIRVRATLRPRDLADLLDPESRLVLCRRLVREGLLEVTGDR